MTHRLAAGKSMHFFYSVVTIFLYLHCHTSLFLVRWKLVHFHDYRTTKKTKLKTLWRSAIRVYSRSKSVNVLYCGGLHLVFNIYFITCSCLANYGASEAVYPCVVVEKIHESF